MPPAEDHQRLTPDNAAGLAMPKPDVVPLVAEGSPLTDAVTLPPADVAAKEDEKIPPADPFATVAHAKGDMLTGVLPREQNRRPRCRPGVLRRATRSLGNWAAAAWVLSTRRGKSISTAWSR
jgi:hypothetical protein